MTQTRLILKSCTETAKRSNKLTCTAAADAADAAAAAAATAAVAPKHRPAAVNALGAEAEVKQPSIGDLVAQVNAVNGAVAKMGQGGGAAAQPAKLVPECTHCGGRHDVGSCWFKHVKKPRGGG